MSCEAQAQIVDRFIRFGSALDLPSLLVKMTPNSVDATATAEDDPVEVWDDLSGNNYDATETTNEPQLHLVSGERQVDFVTANDDFLSIAHANVDLTPGTDEFTIVVKLGDETPNASNYQCLFCKAQLNFFTSAQYAAYTSGGLTNYWIGGDRHTLSSNDWVAEDIIFMVVRTDGADIYINNVKVLDNVSVGTDTTSNDLILGATYQGATANLDVPLSYYLMYTDDLTTDQLTAIYNEIN